MAAPLNQRKNVEEIKELVREHLGLGTAAEQDSEYFVTSEEFAELPVVAFSGSYNDLSNKPTLGTAASQNITAFATAAQGVKADNAVPLSLMGEVNGVATLDEAGKIPAIQLPSYVDDVLEFDDLSEFPDTGDSGKIYVAVDTNTTYRWSGSNYVAIIASPGSTDDVPEGPTNKYFTTNRVRSTLLGTISFLSSAIISASDTISEAFGKLQAQINNLDSAKLDNSSYTAADVLAKIKTVDGSGSGLDAELLGGQNGAFYRNASNINSGTFASDRMPNTINKAITFSSIVTASGDVNVTGSIAVPDKTLSDNSSNAANTKYVDETAAAVLSSLSKVWDPDLNLLMNPSGQFNQTGTNSGPGYCIDGWYSTKATGSISAPTSFTNAMAGITFTTTDASHHGFCTVIPNVFKLSNREITVAISMYIPTGATPPENIVFNIIRFNGYDPEDLAPAPNVIHSVNVTFPPGHPVNTLVEYKFKVSIPDVYLTTPEGKLVVAANDHCYIFAFNAVPTSTSARSFILQGFCVAQGDWLVTDNRDLLAPTKNRALIINECEKYHRVFGYGLLGYVQTASTITFALPASPMDDRGVNAGITTVKLLTSSPNLTVLNTVVTTGSITLDTISNSSVTGLRITIKGYSGLTPGQQVRVNTDKLFSISRGIVPVNNSSAVIPTTV